MKSQTHSSKKTSLVFVVIWFSHHTTFILAFDVDLPYLTMIATISSVYFLASSLPTFQFWTLPLKEVLLFISSGF
jgi:hypothetical protein